MDKWNELRGELIKEMMYSDPNDINSGDYFYHKALKIMDQLDEKEYKLK